MNKEAVFNVEICFTGICAFVPDKAFDQSPTKVSVVMPHAFFEDVSAPPDAADAFPLRRHRAMVQFPLRNMPGVSSTQPDATAVWYLEKQRLTFETAPAPPPAPPPALTVGNLSHVIPISDVAPRFDKVDPAHLAWGVTGKGVTQIMFDRGHLEERSTSSDSWKFTPRLSASTVIMSLASKVILTMSGLTTFKLLARPLAGGDPLLQELTAADGETVTLTIAHLCEENSLLWPTDNFTLVDDQDVKWYFELLNKVPNGDYDQLIQALGGNELPIPRPLNANGQGADCSPAKFAPDPTFVLD